MMRDLESNNILPNVQIMTPLIKSTNDPKLMISLLKFIRRHNIIVDAYLGTIHILRKHFYSTKIKLATKTGVFRQNKRISFSTLHFDEIFILNFEIFSTYKKMLKKIVKMLRLMKKVLTYYT